MEILLVLDAGADPDRRDETRLLACERTEPYAVVNVELWFLYLETVDEGCAVPVAWLTADVGAAGAICIVLFLAVAGAIAAGALHVCEPISDAQQ